MVIILSSLVLSAALTWWFSSSRSPFKILDLPNERSLHTTPVPRTGGIAIFCASLSGWLFIGPSFSIGMVITGSALLILAAISFLDDRLHIATLWRLILQFIVAGLLVFALELPASSPLVQAASVIFLVWMINLYNFMDGMDGFAGGMAAIGFGTLGIIAWEASYPLYALANMILVAACLGFLSRNFPPARIFMGDVGSTFLGACAGTGIIAFHLSGLLPFWLGILVFAPFILDATVTLFRRMFSGERFWEAHKSHYYQRLVQAGWGHRKTVLAEYGLMLACGATAIGARELPIRMQIYVLIIWGVIFGLLMLRVDRIYPRTTTR